MRRADRDRPAAGQGGARPAASAASTSAPHYLEHLLGYVERAEAAQAEGGRQCRQRRRRADHRPARAASAVRVHQGQPRARRHLPATACPTRCWRRTAPPPRTRSRRTGADVGLAWDGDYDRCFFFDEHGQFIEGYYLVGLLAEAFLREEPRRAHRARPAPDLEHARHRARHGGEPVLCKSGHAFIKQKMREVDAAYGGEMSAHHYFRNFSYCDSGMIPWLLVLQVICERGQPLSALVGERMRLFPGQRRDQPPPDDGREVHPGAGAGALRAQGARGRFHRRPVDGVRRTGASTCAAPTPSRWCG